MADKRDYDLCHFHGSPLYDNTWIFLELGHNDSRCTGGAWYYKGDKAKALAELAKRKVEQAEAANAYYSQPWV